MPLNSNARDHTTISFHGDLYDLLEVVLLWALVLHGHQSFHLRSREISACTHKLGQSLVRWLSNIRFIDGIILTRRVIWCVFICLVHLRSCGVSKKAMLLLSLPLLYFHNLQFTDRPQDLSL